MDSPFIREVGWRVSVNTVILRQLSFFVERKLSCAVYMPVVTVKSWSHAGQAECSTSVLLTKTTRFLHRTGICNDMGDISILMLSRIAVYIESNQEGGLVKTAACSQMVPKVDEWYTDPVLN